MHQNLLIKIYLLSMVNHEATLITFLSLKFTPCVSSSVSLLDDVDHQNVPCLVQQLLECDIRQTMAKLLQPGLSLHLIQKLAWQILV